MKCGHCSLYHRLRMHVLLHNALGLDFNNLLALIEATELLGFSCVETGDSIMTPLEETFADDSILAHEETFASRLRRLPFF